MNKRERNTNAREQVNQLSKELGVSYSFIARQLEVDISNFNSWRRGKYEYGSEKLKQVEGVIERYNLMS